MALHVASLTRKFNFIKDGHNIDLKDIDPDMPPTQIMDFYSSHYPELTTGTIEGPTMDGESVSYEFVTHIGVKG